MRAATRNTLNQRDSRQATKQEPAPKRHANERKGPRLLSFGWAASQSAPSLAIARVAVVIEAEELQVLAQTENWSAAIWCAALAKWPELHTWQG